MVTVQLSMSERIPAGRGVAYWADRLSQTIQDVRWVCGLEFGYVPLMFSADEVVRLVRRLCGTGLLHVEKVA